MLPPRAIAARWGDSDHKRPLPTRVMPVTIVNRIKQHLPHDMASAIDVVYDELDELLLASRFDDVSAALDAIVGSDLPVSVLMSARVVYAPWSERIGESFGKLIDDHHEP